MEVSAARLLTIFLVVAVTSSSPATIAPSTSTTILVQNSGANTTIAPKDASKLLAYVRHFGNMKDILMQEINTLDKDTNDARIDEEVAETLKAEAQKDRANLRSKPTPTPSELTTEKVKKIEKDENSEESENDDTYDDDDVSDEEIEEIEDQYNGDDEDDGDDGDDEEDDVDDDEEVMTQCPDYCKCVGQYAAAMTATCSKLVDGQTFGPNISHLRIKDAGEIRLGPNALRARGLQRLESISIVDTHIVELDRTAFNGITYLFAVNLTRNGLQDIHPNTFQNNTQLSLLTISGNPLKHMQDSRHYLLHAPSVTDFVFSNNGIGKLKRTAFSKMRGLTYLNLRGNKLREIDSKILNGLDSLVEMDLSENLLSDIPLDLFKDTPVQNLNVAGNNLSTLATLNAPQLVNLHASRNKIKVIAKEDLDGVPLLNELDLKSNNLRRIHQHALNNLPQLTQLDLSDNKLSSLTDHHFKSHSRLQVLLLSDNPDLKILPLFKTYGLEYNSFGIYRFECANCGLVALEQGIFDEMPVLVRLNLADNHLTELPAGFVQYLPLLKELDLSDNKISSIKEGIFFGALNLMKLSLAGNPLRTMQVTPFLDIPNLVRLDASRCNLERVWSEARVPLKSLRFLSVRDNLLRRITVEELRATPKLTGLDLSKNLFDCDNEFHEAVQWLTDHGVQPTETFTNVNDFGDIDEDSLLSDISQWVDLAKEVCNGIEDGPPPRRPPGKKSTDPKDFLLGFDEEDADSLLRNELENEEKLLKLDIDRSMQHDDDLIQDEDSQLGEITWQSNAFAYETPGFKLWLISGTVLLVLVIFLLVARIACCLANKRGRGPVIRPPLILRPGLVDNKNCGLVYKPLQEEIATPHMPKRGSFYSSSTFHYDKIVPESV